MPKRGVLILLVASSIGLCSCNGPVAGLSVPAVHAQSPIGFVNQSISQMDATHWYVGAEALFDPWGKSGGGTVPVPIPVGKIITRFQGTASWYTNGNCKGPVLASLVNRNPADYSRPPLIYPIILNTNGPGVQLWFDYSTPLQVMHDWPAHRGLRNPQRRRLHRRLRNPGCDHGRLKNVQTRNCWCLR
jgi:hypothetical protein